MKTATVVIPLYKPEPDADERASLAQCCRILGRYPIVLVSPPELDLSPYAAIFEQHNVAFGHIPFDARFFSSIEGYNELMLDPAFYRAFAETEYMLIYQLDAWVFRDELSEWCAKGYDYIGAPWFSKSWMFSSRRKLFSVGNGGFSLRRVRACIDVLEHKGSFKKRWIDLFGRRHNYLIDHLRKLPFSLLRKIQFANTVDFFRAINLRREDMFWGLDTQGTNVPFRVAPLDEAIRFSFERHPSRLFERNGKQLPFGCHAWQRYDADFWKEFIRK